MTFQQLHYLLEVHRAGSVSQAAENLFVSRSSVSIGINNLEAELGYPVFTRSQQGLIPTPKGKLIVEYAARICETHKMMTNVGNDRRGRIIISSADYGPSNNAFVRLVEENKSRSDIRFSLINYSVNEAIEKLTFFEIDVGIFLTFQPYMLELETKLEKKSLQWQVIGTTQSVMCIGPGHRLYNEPTVSPRDLENDLLLDNPRGALTNSRFLKGIMKLSPSKTLISASPSAGLEMISRGLVYSIRRMPPPSIIEQYSLRCIPLEGVLQQLNVVTNPARPLPPEAQRFIALLEEEAAMNGIDIL